MNDRAVTKLSEELVNAWRERDAARRERDAALAREGLLAGEAVSDRGLSRGARGILADREKAIRERDAALAEVERLSKELGYAQRSHEMASSQVRKWSNEAFRLRNALHWLVALKDGPRDARYRDAKTRAWDEARAVLVDTAEGGES